MSLKVHRTDWRLLLSLQGNLDQERLKKQQELAAAALYQQLQQQQLFQLINRSANVKPYQKCLVYIHLCLCDCTAILMYVLGFALCVPGAVSRV